MFLKQTKCLRRGPRKVVANLEKCGEECKKDKYLWFDFGTAGNLCYCCNDDIETGHSPPQNVYRINQGNIVWILSLS